jgi:hypothetical protein
MHRVQTDFDIAKALAVRQLRERHRKKLIETGKRAHAMISSITLDALVELVPGEEIQQLCKNVSTLVHLPLLSIARWRNRGKNARTI